MGPCGGTDGEARKMHMEGGASRNRIVQLYVCHGHAIDSIWLRLRRHEYLTSVEGHYGPFKGQVVVRSLKFVPSLRTLGPYGKEHGMPFALPAGAGGRIIGVHGRSGGKYLNAIGTYVKMAGSS